MFYLIKNGKVIKEFKRDQPGFDLIKMNIEQPSKYHTPNHDYSSWEITSENQIKKEAAEAEELRRSELETEFNNAGIKGKTKGQITQFINNTISGTAEEKLSGIKEILTHVLMKMAKEN